MDNVISHPSQNGLLFCIFPDNQRLQLTLRSYKKNESPDADTQESNYIQELGISGSMMDIWCQWPLQSLGIRMITAISTMSFMVDFSVFNKCIQSSDNSITMSLKPTHSKNHARLCLSCSVLSSLDNSSLEQQIHAYLFDSEQTSLVSEPSIPCPQIHVRFQSLQLLKSVVHGLFMLSTTSKGKSSKNEEIIITGTARRQFGSNDQSRICSLSFNLVHGNIKLNMLTTIWSGQEMHYIIPDNDEIESPSDIVQSIVKVSLRDLYHALQCDSLPPDSIVLGLSDRYALVLYANWPPTMLTFVIPSRFVE